MRIRPTYEELLTKELDDLKAHAAVARRYLETARVEEECEEALSWIRPEIRKSQAEIRRLRKIIARHERNAKRWHFELDAYWIEALERAANRLALEQRHRDEIAEGLQMSRRMRREESIERAKILREFTAQKAQA